MPKITVNCASELCAALGEFVQNGRLLAVVTGGRDFANWQKYRPLEEAAVYTEKWHQKVWVERVMDEVLSLANRYLHVGQGGARGLDKAVKDWCYNNRDRVEGTQYDAEWERLGKSAGSVRNQRMLYEHLGQPRRTWGVVLAFPGGVGTADCVRKALKQGLPVIEVLYNP